MDNFWICLRLLANRQWKGYKKLSSQFEMKFSKCCQSRPSSCGSDTWQPHRLHKRSSCSFRSIGWCWSIAPTRPCSCCWCCVSSGQCPSCQRGIWKDLLLTFAGKFFIILTYRQTPLFPLAQRLLLEHSFPEQTPLTATLASVRPKRKEDLNVTCFYRRYTERSPVYRRKFKIFFFFF